MFFVIVAAIILPLLVIAILVDRSDRKKGHRTRSAAEISRAARDARRTARASLRTPATIKRAANAHRTPPRNERPRTPPPNRRERPH